MNRYTASEVAWLVALVSIFLVLVYCFREPVMRNKCEDWCIERMSCK